MVEDGWLTVDGHELHYLTEGSGPPLVLLHGGIVDSARLSWGAVIGDLAEHYTVIALDLLGYGQSDKPTDRSYSTGMHIDILDGVFAELDLETVTLAGLSLGGAIALGYTLRDPERVDRLVLIDTHGFMPAPPNPLRSYVFSRLPQINKVALRLAARNQDILRASLDGIVANPALLSDVVIEELDRLMQQSTAGMAFRKWRKREITRTGYSTDYRQALSDLSVPTLLLHGAEDAVFPVRWAIRAGSRLPNGRLQIIDECGHWPPREHPDTVTLAITKFGTP